MAQILIKAIPKQHNRLGILIGNFMKYMVIFAFVFSTWACAQQGNSEVKTETVAQAVALEKTGSEEVNWMTVDEALAAQKNEPRKIIIDFYTQWCGPCKMLSKNTFHNPSVAKYINENYYAVKFDAEGNEEVNFKGQKFTNPNYKETKGRGFPHQFSQAFKVNAYPTIVFLDENANFIFPLKGYVDPKGIEPTLKVIASDKYKNIKTKEEFQNWMDNEFTATFE